MIKSQRILVPVKLDTAPDRAFDRALELAARSGAELYLLHAVPLDRSYSSRAAQRLKRFADLRRRAEAAGVAAQTVEQHGDAADIIVLHADTRAVDMIVMSSGRRTGWARFRQPSITESVMRRTIRPTLIVGDGEAAAFNHVLAAVDLSPESAQMVNSAIALPGIDLRRLTVVHALEHIEAADAAHLPARWKGAEYRNYALEAARRNVGVMMQGVETAADVALRVSGGPADAVIERDVAEVGPDLIVIGRSTRLLQFATTARRLLRATDRSVLVVPPPARETRSIYKQAA
jgi:nucleotide-binding universal stress UspA family protein